MKKVEVDVIRRIFVEHGDGAFLEVGPDEDIGPPCIEVRTTDQVSEDYFGKVKLSMDRELAEALGNALLAAVAGEV
jgi:hypothetical protein